MNMSAPHSQPQAIADCIGKGLEAALWAKVVKDASITAD
jgi:serine phosphatase RsbU (regulator of sigma subunit)